MVKYRLLSIEELALFEKEFIDFLVINGIAATDWEAIQKSDPAKADQIVAVFSDVVFEKILRNLNFLEKRDPAVLQFIRCYADKMKLIALKRKDSALDLTAISANEIKFNEVELIQGTKIYRNIRELEIFNLILEGYYPGNGKDWDILHQQLSNIK